LRPAKAAGVSRPARDRGAAPVLALHDLPADAAEPVVLLAQILGWRVQLAVPGLSAPARLCLAPLPPAPGDAASHRPAIVAWSPDNNLNELISRANASVLEQPICIHQVEQLLQALGLFGMDEQWGNPASMNG
jgi:hypothetical protein